LNLKKTSIIIVTYNAMRWIDRTLNSIRTLNEKYETIVVDNNSQDNTVQFIEKNFPEVLLLKENKNHGFGKANNIGINMAAENGAEYIFLLNQDAYVEANTIGKLIEVMESDKKIGIASPIHLNGEGTSLDKLFGTYVAPKLSNDPCPFMSDCYTQQLEKYYEIDFVNAAAWLLSRECIYKVGLFDSLFYHYGEDVNYCQRLNYFNFKLAIVPDSKIYHDRGDRIIKKDTSIDFKKRNLLIELCDINKSEDYIKARIKYLKRVYRRKIIIDFLRGRFSLLRESMEQKSFVNSKKAQIIKSYKKNKNETESV